MRLPVNHALPLAALLLLPGCLSGGDGEPASAPRPLNGPAADYPMVIGDPYVVGDVTYRPEDKLNYDAVGYAAPGQAGGEAISIAHKTLPLPSYVEITELNTGKTILARVERRGPMDNDRLIELSPGAAAQLGVAGGDRIPVRVRRVNPPEPERAALRAGARAPDRMDTPKTLAAVLMRRLEAPASPKAPAALPVTTPATPRKPAAQPAPAPAPAPQPSASPSPPAPPAPVAAAHGHLVVQVGAYSSASRAASAAEAVGGRVERAGQLHRVRIGPFATQAQANAALAKARAAGYTDARIQPIR